MSAAQIFLPQAVGRKLQAVRERRQFVGLLTGVAWAAAVFLGLIMAAMLADWIWTPFEPSMRVLLTASVLFAGLCGFLIWGLLPWMRSTSLPGIAGMVDAAVPQLEERWTTIADLAQTSDPPALRGSSAMIGQVAVEAERLHNLVEPQQVVSSLTAQRNLYRLGAVIAVLAVVWLIDRPQVSVLWQRFWSPTREISLTAVTSSTADTVVPRGEPLSIQAVLQHRLRNQATIWVRDESGEITRHSMKPDSQKPDEFSFPIAAVAAPLEYRIRAGDGQTPWHRIEVADRPRITGIDFRIVPPAYSKLAVFEQQGLPRRTRALEESTLEIEFQVSEPLREFQLMLPDDQTLPVKLSSEGTYRFQQVLTKDFAFSPHLISQHNLTNEKPPSCHIVTYRDQFPTVSLVSPHDNLVLRPEDNMTVEFTARDDFGIAKAELVVTDPAHPDEPLRVIDIPLEDQQGQPEVTAKTQLDLKELQLKTGAELNYAVRVYDTKDSSGTSGRASSSDTEAQPAEETAQRPAAEAPESSSSEKDQDSSADPAVAQTDPVEQGEQPPSEPANPGNASQSSTSAADAKSAPQSTAASQDTEQPPASRQEGAARPTDDMARRSLKLGQCTACKPLNLKIDEWAGSFDGQMREKLEIAIEEYLAKQDAALQLALKENEGVFTRFQQDSGWSDEQIVGVRKTTGHLAAASQIALDLAAKSAGTPYAFMGLQLREIDERHVAEAQAKLDGLAQQEPAERKSGLEASLFHIRRARELLAGLSRTYQGVKINHQLAEAMTRVKQMHQVFIEDTFKLLGSAKPVLNPKQRKFLELELDEEFRKKLKALLEKKRDVQAELAKILAEHPDLLRRFMSRARVDADSLRDQLTIFAQRQTELRDETQAFLKKDDNAAQDAALASQNRRMTLEISEISQAAALLFENFETWLPADVEATHAAVQSAQDKIKSLATLADQLASGLDEGNKASEQTQKIYDQLQELEAELTQVATAFPNHPKLTTHVANRRAEIAKLNTLVSGWQIKSQALEKKDRLLIQLVDQTQLTNATSELTNKIANFRAWISGLPPEIGEMADELNSLLEEDLLNKLVDAEDQLGDNNLEKTEAQQTLAVATFAKSEQQFDKLLEAIIAHLDSLPVNNKPTVDEGNLPNVDDLLALLEDEKLAAEGLGIPCCRPSNLSIVQDWLSPSKGGGMGAGMASSASSQSQQAQQNAQKLQDAANGRRNKLIAGTRRSADAKPGVASKRENPRWNTLASKLEDGLKQVRGQAPPQKYRSAIERYFEVISDDSAADIQK